MKTKPTLLAGILILLASAVNAQTSTAPDGTQWRRWTIKGEEFSVGFPASPDTRTRSVPAPGSQKTRTERRWSTSVDGVIYAFYVYDNRTQDQSLADFISEQSAKYRPQIIAERDIEVNGFAGREYKWRDKDRLTIEQFFATEQHLFRFVVSVVGTDPDGANHFFSSIKLGKAESAEAPTVLETATGETIFTAKDVDKKARITNQPPPVYTEEAKKNHVTGIVILKVVLASTGQVSNIRVISGLPFGLTERAIAAARQLQFTPAMKDGKPVSMWMQVEFNFNLY